MKFVKKNVAYMKHIFLMTFSNIPRLILSVSGLFVGLLVLTVGSILMDTYYNELQTKAHEYSPSSVIVNVNGKNGCIEDIIKKVGSDNVWRDKTCDFRETIYNKRYTNGYYLSLNANIIGTTSGSNNDVLMKYDDNTWIPVKSELVCGRWIDGQDLLNNKKVIVIDDFTAYLLYGKEDCVGETIEFGVDEECAEIMLSGEENVRKREKFEIIGVFKNKELTKNNQFQYRKFVADGNKNTIMETNAYIPMNEFENIYKEDNIKEYLVWNSITDKTVSAIEKCEMDFSSECEEFKIVTKESILDNLKKELVPIKAFMLVILSALFIISGINTMNIMFFSIKERMGEIGIKKANGATSIDIILQFMMEGLITAYIAGILAAFIAGVVAKVIGVYIENTLFFGFDIVYAKDTILLVFIVSSVYGIVFSFLPSFWGAKSKVTDALRFE